MLLFLNKLLRKERDLIKVRNLLIKSFPTCLRGSQSKLNMQARLVKFYIAYDYVLKLIKHMKFGINVAKRDIDESKQVN